MKSEKLPLHMLGLMEGAGLHPGRGMPVGHPWRKATDRPPGVTDAPSVLPKPELGQVC